MAGGRLYQNVTSRIKAEITRADDVYSADELNRVRTVEAIKRVAETVADAFREDNLRFDYDHFRKACGYSV